MSTFGQKRTSAVITERSMNDLLVTEVRPVSPGDESAEVTLFSGKGEVIVFCHPCSYSVGDRVPNRLSILDGEAKVPYFSDWPEDEKARVSQERLERIGTWDYRGCGLCLDEKEGLVVVKGFVIEMGEVLWDGPIEFEINRLTL